MPFPILVANIDGYFEIDFVRRQESYSDVYSNPLGVRAPYSKITRPYSSR